MLTIITCAIFLLVPAVHSLDNGLALTPPMGWLTWERFRCNTDCKNDPKNCISERLIKEMADAMVKGKYLDAGYEYIIVDDCWPSKQRDAKGRLVPDPVRFPSGMKALADYVHAKGLKFGIYEDFGSKTCGGYPGSEFYMQQDANTFAEWGVDYVKLDGCYSDVRDMDIGYPIMGFWLNQTGRPMVYSCSWPAYSSKQPNYEAIAKTCNLWRNYADIQDSWDSVANIVEHYGVDQYNFSKYAGPGRWNDPDMIIIGNYGLSYVQQRAQMAMWAIMASPLILSVDLRIIHPASQAIILNKNVLAINQDKLGIQGTRIFKQGSIQIWRRPIMPKGSFAFAVLNTGTGGMPAKVYLKISELTGVATNFTVTEVFDNRKIGLFKAGQTMTAQVDPSGGVFMFTAKPTK